MDASTSGWGSESQYLSQIRFVLVSFLQSTRNRKVPRAVTRNGWAEDLSKTQDLQRIFG